MANAENLKGKGFDARSTSEARELGRKGGKASGESRRRKRALKMALHYMLTAPLPADHAKRIAVLGIDPEDADYQAAVGAALIKRALAGDVAAIALIATLTHDDPYVAARQADNRMRREEHKERVREFDLTRQDNKERAAADAEIWDWAEALVDAYGYDAAREG